MIHFTTVIWYPHNENVLSRLQNEKQIGEIRGKNQFCKTNLSDLIQFPYSIHRHSHNSNSLITSVSNIIKTRDLQTTLIGKHVPISPIKLNQHSQHSTRFSNWKIRENPFQLWKWVFSYISPINYVRIESLKLATLEKSPSWDDLHSHFSFPHFRFPFSSL